MDSLRRRIVADFEKGAGRHDDPRVYGGPPGDPGLIGPGSMSWEINADLASVSQAGLPAIVLEILHPSVVAGVQDLSNYRQDPFQRARATLGYVLTTTFGNTAAATAVIEHVKHVHSFVNGTRPDGVPYRALDPELIAWVHTCIPWMIMRAYEHTKRPLTQSERDRYLAEQAVIGRMGGADWVPASAAELDDYIDTMRPRLSVNAQTREFIDFLMTSPFFPDLPDALDRRLHRFAIYAGMSRAPQWAQELIGFDRPSILTRNLIEPALRLDARRLRWAFGTPRYAQLALIAGGGRDDARGRRAVIDAQLLEVVGGATAASSVDETGRPHQPTHPRRRAARGGRCWPATHYGRGRGAASRCFPDDRLPPLPAPRRPGRGAGAPRDPAFPGRGRRRDRRGHRPPRRGGRGIHRGGQIRPRTPDAASGGAYRAGPDRPLGPVADNGFGLHRRTTFTAKHPARRRSRCGGWPTSSRGCSSRISRCRPPIPISATTPNCAGSHMRFSRR